MAVDFRGPYRLYQAPLSINGTPRLMLVALTPCRKSCDMLRVNAALYDAMGNPIETGETAKEKATNALNLAAQAICRNDKNIADFPFWADWEPHLFQNALVRFQNSLKDPYAAQGLIYAYGITQSAAMAWFEEKDKNYAPYLRGLHFCPEITPQHPNLLQKAIGRMAGWMQKPLVTPAPSLP